MYYWNQMFCGQVLSSFSEPTQQLISQDVVGEREDTYTKVLDVVKQTSKGLLNVQQLISQLIIYTLVL